MEWTWGSECIHVRTIHTVDCGPRGGPQGERRVERGECCMVGDREFYSVVVLC
ncbi:MAG: hypothetical protein RI897_1466 [Verrucomicrobiota bacterium]